MGQAAGPRTHAIRVRGLMPMSGSWAQTDLGCGWHRSVATLTPFMGAGPSQRPADAEKQWSVFLRASRRKTSLQSFK